MSRAALRAHLAEVAPRAQLTPRTVLGLPIFRRSFITADCEACGARFEPSQGGVCSRCRRILCGRHLHGGSLWRRIRVELGAPPVCVDCRAGPGPEGRSAARAD